MAWWPAELSHGDVLLRPLRLRDGTAWREARLRNQDWLERWEGAPPTAPDLPWDERHTLPVFASVLRAQRRLARQGASLPFGVTLAGRLIGQVTVSSVVRGAFDSATLGYWVDREVAGRGITPTAVALVVDHCFAEGLHRVEISIRPENAASLRVVEKLGLRPEGRHERYLFIDGAWRDHLSFAVTREEVPDGLLHRWLASGRDTPRHLHQE